MLLISVINLISIPTVNFLSFSSSRILDIFYKKTFLCIKFLYLKFASNPIKLYGIFTLLASIPLSLPNLVVFHTLLTSILKSL